MASKKKAKKKAPKWSRSGLTANIAKAMGGGKKSGTPNRGKSSKMSSKKKK